MDKTRNLKEVRCEGARKHYIRGVEYECCGSLLFNINTDCEQDAQIRCRVCKRLWDIKYDPSEQELSVEEVPAEEDEKFKRRGKKDGRTT